MAATVTKVDGPFYQQGRGVGYTFSVLLDNSFAAGGEALDLTSHFSYVYSGTINDVDAAADATWRYTMVLPARTTAVTSSNVLVVAHHGSGADAVDNPADAEDLSTVGELQCTVWGRKAIPTSWA